MDRSQRKESALPWAALTHDLAALLLPVKPQPTFRAALRQSLLAEAYQQQAQRQLDLPARAAAPAVASGPLLPGRMMDWLQQGQDWQREHPWTVVGAAAVGSAVSLMGVAAYVMRSRGRRQAA